MAEQNYVVSSTGDGNVNIGEDVFVRLVAAAVDEMDAVAGLSTSCGPELAELIGRKSLAKGVFLTTEENGTLRIDIALTMHYGYNVAETAEAVQREVIAAVEAMTGIVCRVNVHVVGISFEKAEIK